MIYNSKMNRPQTISYSQLSSDCPIYEEREENGVKRLVVTGTQNMKDFIEASKEETLISNIIERFNRGDVNALSRVQGFYGDVTSMPSDYRTSCNLLIDLENKFNSLSDDIKLKFDNSFDKFVKDVANMDVTQFVDTFNKKVDVNIEPDSNNLAESGVVNE